MSDTAPERYPRRILLVLSGMSPQVLTETLWVLTQRSSPAFVPTEIYLLTTVKGARNARLNLLDTQCGQYIKFCQTYDLPVDPFTSCLIRVITDTNGQPLEDIRSPQENEAAADYITETIRSFTDDDQSALHVSMAGGRKTMGYYAGYALSLFGRQQDRLSHVLVSSPFEGLPNFYFPTPGSELIATANHGVLDTHEAEVTLAEIPFVRLRQEVPEALLEGRAGFSETIQRAQRINEPVHLVVDLLEKRLVASGADVILKPVEFAFYTWMIRRQLDGAPEPGVRDLVGEPNRGFAEELLAIFERIEGEMGRDIDRTRDGLKNGLDRGFFDEKKSRVNSQFAAQLGKSLAQRYQITGFGRRGSTRFNIPLEAEQIDWRD